MSGTLPVPWSDAMSLTRVPSGGAAVTGTARTAARVVASSKRRMSEHLVEQPDEEPGREIVFHQAASEIADAQLPHRRGEDDVARIDVARAHHAGQDHDLPVAVDLDLANPFDDEVAVGQHLGDARRD